VGQYILRKQNRTADKLYPSQAIQLLERSQEFDSSIPELIHNLRELRNEAAHAPKFAISSDVALEYAALAAQVAEYLRSKHKT